MKYTVGPGRTIERDGVPILEIHRTIHRTVQRKTLAFEQFTTTPVEADELTHKICALLNAVKHCVKCDATLVGRHAPVLAEPVAERCLDCADYVETEDQ